MSRYARPSRGAILVASEPRMAAAASFHFILYSTGTYSRIWAQISAALSRRIMHPNADRSTLMRRRAVLSTNMRAAARSSPTSHQPRRLHGLGIPTRVATKVNAHVANLLCSYLLETELLMIQPWYVNSVLGLPRVAVLRTVQVAYCLCMLVIWLAGRWTGVYAALTWCGRLKIPLSL